MKKTLLLSLLAFILTFLYVNSYANYEEAKAALLRGEEKVAYDLCNEDKYSPDCMNLLGVIHERQGTPEHSENAMWFFRKAANLGYAKSQTNLAFYHLYGMGGLPKNPKEFVKWMRKAAEQGDPVGQGNLGRAYSNGTGVLEDHKESVKWLLKAAKKDHAFSQALLGFKYAIGKGVLKDRTQARYWVQKAYASDDPEAVQFAENIWNDLNLGGAEKTNNNNSSTFKGLFGDKSLYEVFKPISPPVQYLPNPVVRTRCYYIGTTLNCTSQ